MSNSQIELASVNFDDIESSLIDWLKQRPEWADYDFTVPGSASALLIDILCGITYKQNVQSNFAMNETFLSTARLRNNVLRRARELNYTTHSPVAASAKLRIKFTPADPVEFVIIPKGTRFQASGVDKVYTFITETNYTATRENDYTVDIDIVEGEYLNYQWTVSQNQKYFVIPNPAVDTTRLYVNVKYTKDDIYWTEYSKSKNIVDNNGESTVYYVEELDQQYFRIYFGDDYISKAIKPGNIVSVDYLCTSGSVANNIVLFDLMDYFEYPYTVETIQPSHGGQDVEAIDSIKRYAPLSFYSQNRAVVDTDYEYLVKENFPQISSVSVWGGEDNTPPLFGRVCMSAITGGNYVLSNSLKSEIASLFDNNKIIGSKRISWFDPVVIQILTNLKIFYNPAFTAETPTSLRLHLQEALLEYQNRINRFRNTFNFSDFVTFIKSLDRSFIDVICDIALNYSYVPTSYTDLQTISVEYNVGLKPNTLKSSRYYNENNILAYLKDDGMGNVNEYTLTETAEIMLKSNIGSVDYNTGFVNISDITIHSLFQSEYLDIEVVPSTYNVSAKHQIVFNLNGIKSQIEITKSSI